MGKVSEEEFFNVLRRINEATSVRDKKKYYNICFKGCMITGIRKDTQNSFAIDANKLYEAYLNCSSLNTSSLKQYVKNRTQSPALAILKAGNLA